MYKDFLGLDLPFIRTSKLLILAPEKITLAYINGVRKVFQTPAHFALIVLSIYGIYQYFFSDFLELIAQTNFISGVESGFNRGSNEDPSQIIGPVLNWMQKHHQFMNFSLIPILGISNRWVYGTKTFNLAEHLVIAIYAVSFSILVMTLLGTVVAISGSPVLTNLFSEFTLFLQTVTIIWVVQRSMKQSFHLVIMTMLITLVIFLILFVVILLSTIIILG